MMKLIKNITIIAVMLFCVATNTYSQELAKIVNSPKALQLETEMKGMKSELDTVSKAYFDIDHEFNRLYRQGKARNDLSLYNQFSKERRSAYNSLRRRMDSLSNLFDKTRVAHSTEIIRTAEMKAVLQKMQEAMKAGDGGKASRIRKDYFDLLRHAASEKFRLGQITHEDQIEEIKAIFKINIALGDLAFRPVKLINGKRVPY